MTLPSGVRVLLSSSVGPLGLITIPARTELVLDDIVLVKAGEVIPVDGDVVAGTSAVDESILSGESEAIAKTRGAAVLGGTLNLDSPLQIRVRRLINDSLMAEISRLAQDAQACKPRLTVLADRIASKFILGVLLIAACVAAYWSMVDPSRVMATTIAVLVISCPCALALATPPPAPPSATFASAAGWMRAEPAEALAPSSRGTTKISVAWMAVAKACSPAVKRKVNE